MYNHNKAQQSNNRVHISWDILYTIPVNVYTQKIPRAFSSALGMISFGLLITKQMDSLPQDLGNSGSLKIHV